MEDDMKRIEGFYHYCWLKLKADFPRMQNRMTSIELQAMGLAPKQTTKAGTSLEGNDEPINIV